MKIYVASSFRNEHQQNVVKALREVGHDVYDFKEPNSGDVPFHWSQIDSNWQYWNNIQFAKVLNHPLVERGFNNDYNAMMTADVCVIVTPCGRSAHVEAGWMQGSGKPTILLLNDGEPELMYKMFQKITHSIEEVIVSLEDIEKHLSVKTNYGDCIN